VGVESAWIFMAGPREYVEGVESGEARQSPIDRLPAAGRRGGESGELPESAARYCRRSWLPWFGPSVESSRGYRGSMDDIERWTRGERPR